MKLKTLNNPAFIQAIQKILKSELPVKTAWKVKKIVDKLDAEQRKYHEMQQCLLKKYGQQDKNGQLISDDNSRVPFKSDEDLKLYVQEINELLDVDVEISKLNIDELGDIKLTAIELTLLEDMLKD